MAASLIRDLLVEGLDINLNEYRRVEITLAVIQTAAGTDKVTYKVPQNYKLMIEGCRGHLAMTAIASEVLNIGNLTSNLSIMDRIAMKAMNCRLQLTNNDMQLPFFENAGGSSQGLSLASILETANGRAFDWKKAPAVVLGGQTIQLDSTLIQSNDYVLGGRTEYGVVLTGLLVRARGDK